MKSVVTLAAAVAVVAAGAGMVRADVPGYQLVGQYAAPGALFDVLPDGRVVFLAGSEFRVADVRTGAAATVMGSLPAGVVPAFGASFVSVSPDGSRIAVGDNGFGAGASVHVVSVADLTTAGPTGTTAFASPNTEGVWAGGSTLLVTGFGTSSVLTRIDTTLAGTAAARTLVTGIGDGSGGVAVDGAGRVYVGLGFDAGGGARTGEVRAFELAMLEGAGSAAEYDAGVLVARALSGSSLGFDAGGHLLVGGGDFFSGSGDFGSAAVIDGASVARVLAGMGGGGIDPVSAQLRLSPAGAGAFYAVRFNGATGEVLVGDGTTIYRYVVPGPGGAAVMAAWGAGALMAGRRRRHG